MDVIILRGISGSGKSHLASRMRLERVGSRMGEVTSVSADDYFMRGGKYCFDPEKIEGPMARLRAALSE
jgi:uridine kinase